MKIDPSFLAGLVRRHFQALLFAYLWFGLFVSGLLATDERVALLQSSVITEGWHLSLLSCVLVLPWPVLYAWRQRGSRAVDASSDAVGSATARESTR